MKAILEFNLPEEDDEFHYAKEGISYSIVIEDTLNHIRSILKYEENPKLDVATLEHVRGFIIEALSERGLNR